ncbi:hypothetical protein NC652_024267 [Populus alba x Populus x berolinensis]|nr:hypothetical protein NC652_024267 [Populus alba x Populus x berolinensis]
MKEKRYNKECADACHQILGLDAKKIDKCMGNPDADSDNPVLKEEQNAQVGKGSRGDVTILPTLVVNNRQYRGLLLPACIMDEKLHLGIYLFFFLKNMCLQESWRKVLFLKAICSGFEETTEPEVCLSGALTKWICVLGIMWRTNECLDNNGGCWQDKTANITACRDTFRGRVCECPLVDGVQFKGDGYSHCEVSGSGRCKINNGGCWHDISGWTHPSLLVWLDVDGGKCQCPPGFKGDGVKSCVGAPSTCPCGLVIVDSCMISQAQFHADVDECQERKACQCSACSCKNTWGSSECSCSGDLLYIRDHDTCISKSGTEGRSAWAAVWVILLGLVMAGGGGYLIYKYRLRSYMDSEIRAIMAQYMPLDSQAEVPNHVHDERT